MEESLLYIYIWRYKTVRTFEFAVCATVCKTVRPMLSDRCPVLSVCDVRALWPNGWTDQDETWHAGIVQFCFVIVTIDHSKPIHKQSPLSVTQ